MTGLLGVTDMVHIVSVGLKPEPVTAVILGNVHDIREKLRAIGISYFQGLVLERYGRHNPLEKVRGEFEAEEPALAPNADILVELYEITYRGKVHHATQLLTRRLPSDIVAYDPEPEYAETNDTDETEDWEDDDFVGTNPSSTQPTFSGG